jgi:xanthine dehydrogenase accessory factor
MTPNNTDERKRETPNFQTNRNSPERIEQLAHTLSEQGKPFARAIVVRREPPVSANVGDSVLITPEGDVLGWIGGVECAQSTIVREGLAAIESEESKLVGLAPNPEEIDRPGMEAFQMTCHSGGTLEVFIEAVTPSPQLLIVGNSPIATALAQFTTELAFDVVIVDPDHGDYPADAIIKSVDPVAINEAVTGIPFVVVASMGAYDASGIVAGIACDAPYIGLVASDKRATAVIDRAADQLGVDPEHVRKAVTNPAGVHIEARTPEEIAVSIVAEVIDIQHTSDKHSGIDTNSTPDEVETAVDPVCGMEVPIDDPPATVEYGGDIYYFCCSGCEKSFDENPNEYVQTT